MITFHIVHGFMVISVVLVPIQLITSFIFGILSLITFDLLLIPISFIWTVLFLGPITGLSYVYEKVAILRPFVAITGIPFAVIGNIYIQLIGAIGDNNAKMEKFIICRTFPYTWRYLQYKNNKLNIHKDDVLAKILKQICGSKPFKNHLDDLRADVYSRPDYMNGKYGVGW